jgi:hypothetical protein
LYSYTKPLKTRAMIVRAFLNLTLAVALVLIGFGHQPITATKDAQASAYVLAGGSWADICGQSGDPRNDSATQCQACVIGQSCPIDAPMQIPVILGFADVLRDTAPQTMRRLSTVDWANGARAPPLA